MNMNEISKYQHIASVLREQILTSQYPVGHKLPSEHQLMKQYSVSRQTVRNALELLQEQQLIQRVQGKGSLVISQAPITKTSTYNVGVIIPAMTNTSLFPIMLRSISDVLQQSGYSTLFAETQDRFDKERKILQNMLDKQVDGLIIGGTKCILPSPNLSYYAALTDAGIPYTFIHTCPPELTNAIHISMDNQQGGYLITKYLIDRGYRHIGCALKLHSVQGVARYEGFQKAMTAAGLFFSDDDMLWFTNSDDLHSYSNHELSGIAACEAIVSFNDYTASILTAKLRAMGRRVHEDICITGFDSTEPSHFFPSPVPECGWAGVGVAAVQTLLKQIRREKVTSTIFNWVMPSLYDKKHFSL